jgi:glycosyltransferase involved in cell wall biosynthesis
MSQALIIIPCYNEASRFDAKAVSAFLESQTEVELCFVNDGSRDNTQKVLHNFAIAQGSRAKVLELKQNQGKAGAVRAGMLHALELNAHPYLGYWDADLATPLEEVGRFMTTFNSSQNSVIAVIGSRIKRLGSEVDRSATRHVLGRVFSTFAALVLRLPVYDTQCGAKIFKSEIAAGVFRDPFISRWLFDLEILARLRNAYGIGAVISNVIELPLMAWHEKGDSRLKASDLVRVPFDLWRIYRRYPVL